MVLKILNMGLSKVIYDEPFNMKYKNKEDYL